MTRLMQNFAAAVAATLIVAASWSAAFTIPAAQTQIETTALILA
jgi:hypothetical protein